MLPLIFQDSGVKLCLCATPELAANVPAPGPPRIDDQFPALEQADPSEIVPRAPEDPAALLYTGGTTGRSKGVLLSHENLWFAGKAGHDAGHIPGITRGLLALPLSHAYGLLVTVVGLHAVQPRQRPCSMRWFDPIGWLELAQDAPDADLRGRALHGSSSYWRGRSRMTTSQIPTTWSRGRAPLPAELAQELIRRIPQLDFSGRATG